MDWKTLINEGSIAVVLIVAIAAEVFIVYHEGTANLVSLGLPGLILALGGGLLGSKIPKP